MYLNSIYSLVERGRFQRTLDGIAELTREHQGTVTGGGLFAGGIAVEQTQAPGREFLVVPMITAGAVIGGISSFVDYANNILEKYWTKEDSSSNEAVLVDTQLPLAGGTEERPAST